MEASNPAQSPAPVQPAQAPVAPPVGTPPAAAPAPAPAQKNKALIIIGAIVIILLVAALLYRQITQKPQEPVAPTPTPTASPTPTPIRELSGIAGQPAFMELEAAVASLSSSIRGYNVQDPSLSPPSLILKLGFSD